MRKGRCFYPSKKVLWKNRHALVLGCSNFYRNGDDDDVYNLKEDNKEYDIVEPPEPSPDPYVPTTGVEFSSDNAGDGPVQRKFLSGRNKFQSNDESKENPLIVDKIRTGSAIQNLKKSRS